MVFDGEPSVIMALRKKYIFRKWCVWFLPWNP